MGVTALAFMARRTPRVRDVEQRWRPGHRCCFHSTYPTHALRRPPASVWSVSVMLDSAAMPILLSISSRLSVLWPTTATILAPHRPLHPSLTTWLYNEKRRVVSGELDDRSIRDLQQEIVADFETVWLRMQKQPDDRDGHGRSRGHGTAINARTLYRDQQRTPMAADLKRSMRERR